MFGPVVESTSDIIGAIQLAPMMVRHPVRPRPSNSPSESGLSSQGSESP